MLIDKRKTIIAMFIYLSAAILTRVFAVKNAAWLVGADMDSYIRQGAMLLHEGRFAMPGAADLSTFHTPLYPALIAANMWVFGDDVGPYAMIYEQIILLFLTGLTVAAIVARTHPSLAFSALLLMIFNPNSFAAAQGTQPETVFTFLLVSALYLFFAFVRSKRFWLLPAIGLLVAVATYCRPVGLYLGLMIPAGVALYATIGCVSFQQGARQVVIYFVRSLIVIIVIILALAPWYSRNYDIVGQYVLSTNLGLYLRDNVILVYAKTAGKPVQEMPQYFDDRFDTYLARREAKPRHKMNDAEESSALAQFSFHELSDQPASSIMRLAAHSVLFLYGSGGTGTLRDLWGFEDQGLHVIEHFEGDGSIFGPVSLFLGKISPGYMLLLFLGLAFSFILRLLGLNGLFAMLRSQHWRDFVIYCSIRSVFTGMYMFAGQSRFRPPMEPILVIIALWGWGALFRKKGTTEYD